MDHFGDPTYEYHAALTKIWGLLTLRLASQPVLEFTAITYANELAGYYEQLLQAGFPHKFSKLKAAIDKFEEAAKLLDAQAAAADKTIDSTRLDVIKSVNNKLAFFERQFIDPQGISGREWFKHVVIGE
jgi:hypothetical protein